jgi:hypothetical protein
MDIPAFVLTKGWHTFHWRFWFKLYGKFGRIVFLLGQESIDPMVAQVFSILAYTIVFFFLGKIYVFSGE